MALLRCDSGYRCVAAMVHVTCIAGRSPVAAGYAVVVERVCARSVTCLHVVHPVTKIYCLNGCLQGLFQLAADSNGLPASAVIVAAAVLHVSAVLADWLRSSLKYDMHNIPVAPFGVPVLGRSLHRLQLAAGKATSRPA